MQNLLDKKEDAHDEEVERTLGTSVAALYSVPTAIFCFLRACTPIPEIDVCKAVSKNYPLHSLYYIIYKEK
jgi:ADP-ribosylglycohydrolase